MSEPKHIKIDIEEDIDYKIESIEWNTYELDDGTRLKIINVPMKIFRLRKRDPKGFPEYMVTGKILIKAYVRPEIRGVPTKNNEPIDDSTVEPIEFQILNEPWNQFTLIDGTILKLRTIVGQTYIIKDKFNELGEPIYKVTSKNMITVIPNPALKLPK